MLQLVHGQLSGRVYQPSQAHSYALQATIQQQIGGALSRCPVDSCWMACVTVGLMSLA